MTAHGSPFDNLTMFRDQVLVTCPCRRRDPLRPCNSRSGASPAAALRDEDFRSQLRNNIAGISPAPAGHSATAAAEQVSAALRTAWRDASPADLAMPRRLTSRPDHAAQTVAFARGVDNDARIRKRLLGAAALFARACAHGHANAHMHTFFRAPQRRRCEHRAVVSGAGAVGYHHFGHVAPATR